MTTLAIESGGRTYAIDPDASLQLDALLVGRAIDELIGAPPRDRLSVSARVNGVPPAVSTEAGGFAIATGEGGAFAVSGLAERAFPELALTPYTVDVTLGCPGFLSTPVTVDLPAGTAGFPVELPDALLRRPAVLLGGRVVTAAVAPEPVVGAQVEVAAPAGMIGFGAPFAFAHQAGTTIVPVPLNPTGPDLDLLADLMGGATEFGLARRDGLTAGAVLELGAGEDREYAVLTAVQGPVDRTLPGAVELRAPLAFPHRRANGPARLVLEGAPAPSATLTASAFAEDRVAFVDDPSALPDDGPVRVEDSDAGRVEYHVARRARATTDAAGYYRLGPIGRTSTVTVHLSPPVGPSPDDFVHIVSYGTPENVLNLRA